LKTNARRSRKTRKIKKIFMSLVILFIILSVSYIVKGKLPFYFDKVTAGQITEEVDDPSSIDID